ncbi:MAG: FMN-binding protein [Oscillospiraceae bacterium]|jgi:electron transport complex protein RnfG|nr:FMN-binding protein [Oscillospiraceae bacterium]
MEMIKNNYKYILKLGLTLLVITTAVALLLAGVNAITSGRIEELTLEKTNRAIEAVMPGCTVGGDTVEGAGYTLIPMEKNGGAAGYCVSVSPSGFGGSIDMIVGIVFEEDGRMSVGGVSIVSMTETAGLGTKAKDEAFLGQYKGLTGVVGIGGGENEISAVSGATVTSKAVTEGVNTALEAARQAIWRES